MTAWLIELVTESVTEVFVEQPGYTGSVDKLHYEVYTFDQGSIMILNITTLGHLWSLIAPKKSR